MIPGPGLGGHLQCLALKALGGVAGHIPEAPEELAGVDIEGGHRAAYAGVRAVVAHEDLAVADARRSRDARFSGIDADRRGPELTPRGRIERDHAAVAGPNEDFALPDRHPAIGARRGGITQHREPHVRIEFPQHPPAGRVDRVDPVERGGGINRPVHHDRLGGEPHRAVDIDVPGEAELIDVLVIDLLERTEVRRAEAAAITGQLIPCEASARTRASVTLPAGLAV